MQDGGGFIEVVGMISFLALRVISVGFIRRGSSILPLPFTDAVKNMYTRPHTAPACHSMSEILKCSQFHPMGNAYKIFVGKHDGNAPFLIYFSEDWRITL